MTLQQKQQVKSLEESGSDTQNGLTCLASELSDEQQKCQELEAELQRAKEVITDQNTKLVLATDAQNNLTCLTSKLLDKQKKHQELEVELQQARESAANTQTQLEASQQAFAALEKTKDGQQEVINLISVWEEKLKLELAERLQKNKKLEDNMKAQRAESQDWLEKEQKDALGKCMKLAKEKEHIVAQSRLVLAHNAQLDWRVQSLESSAEMCQKQLVCCILPIAHLTP